MKRIGIDIGGVILSRENKDFDKSHITSGKQTRAILQKQERKRVLDAVFLPYCQEIISLLAQAHVFELFIVSYCKSVMQERNRKILRMHGFLGWIPECNWIFVEDRKDKAQICATYALDIMIDDRLDVLENIQRQSSISVALWWFNGNSNHLKKQGKNPIVVIKDWLHVRSLLICFNQTKTCLLEH